MMHATPKMVCRSARNGGSTQMAGELVEENVPKKRTICKIWNKFAMKWRYPPT